MTRCQILAALLPVLSFLCVCVGWIARGASDQRQRNASSTALERFRRKKASLRGALREGER